MIWYDPPKEKKSNLVWMLLPERKKEKGQMKIVNFVHIILYII